jgi:16S rRNA (cytosine1402-N4)-methyltransferase
MSFHHITVLLDEPIRYITEPFEADKEYYVLDGTFGGGGHSLTFAERHKNVHMISFDQDPTAIENGKGLIKEKGLEERVNLIQDNFVNLTTHLDKMELAEIDGAIFDLGVSSHQFDEKSRGFSFQEEAFLNMRMDQDESKLTAYKIVNQYNEEDLAYIFSNYGEERFSNRIASRIVEERSRKELRTTKQLEDIIFHAYPKKMRFGKTHPATRCFQALRIEANGELEVLKKVIPEIAERLSSGSRLAIISFHSLEDRIVKLAFKELKSGGGFNILTKKPLVPSDEEISNNKRSRSAKMRVIEKI